PFLLADREVKDLHVRRGIQRHVRTEVADDLRMRFDGVNGPRRPDGRSADQRQQTDVRAAVDDRIAGPQPAPEESRIAPEEVGILPEVLRPDGVEEAEADAARAD